MKKSAFEIPMLRLAEYKSGPTAELADQIMNGFKLTAPPRADVSKVAEAIAKVVDMPFGKRPFRVHVDAAEDGAEVVNGIADHVRAEMLRSLGLVDLLRPTAAFSVRQLNQGHRATA